MTPIFFRTSRQGLGLRQPSAMDNQTRPERRQPLSAFRLLSPFRPFPKSPATSSRKTEPPKRRPAPQQESRQPAPQANQAATCAAQRHPQPDLQPADSESHTLGHTACSCFAGHRPHAPRSHNANTPCPSPRTRPYTHKPCMCRLRFPRDGMVPYSRSSAKYAATGEISRHRRTLHVVRFWMREMIPLVSSVGS